MAKTLDFIIDVASPNAYLSYNALKGVLERTGAQVEYHPCLLGGIFKATNNQAPMLAFADVKGKLAYQNLELERFVKRHGLTKYKINPHFPVMTVAVMRGAIVAKRDGFLEDYLTAMLAAMWEEGAKLDDPEELGNAWQKAGFDAAMLAQEIQTDAVKQQLIDNTSKAVERGAFGVPTFFVGAEMFYGKETLPLIEEELQK